MPATIEPRTAVPPQAQASWNELHGRVHAVRRRHALKLVMQGVFLGLAIFAAAFLGFSLVDIFFKLSVASRVAWLAAALGGLVGAIFLASVKPFARLGGAVQTAREVEGAFPELENQLSTTLEYGADQRLVESSGPELVGALIRRTEARTEPLDFGRTVRWRRALLALLLAAVVGGCFALYGLISPRLFSTTWKRFLNPTAPIAPPTLTVIEKLQPGSGSYPVESSVMVSVTLSGRLPETATLMLQKPDDPPDRWEERVMERAPDGAYHAYLRRMLDTVRYKIAANDTESDVFTLRVYREPQIDEITVRLEYPEYTRRAPETLPPGQELVSALRGTKLTVNLKANTELARAEALFESKRTIADAKIEGRTAQLSFDLTRDDTYQLHIQDREGHSSASPSTYRLKALKDQRPSVRIRKPGRDLMVHRDQTVKLEISATDDLGVSEIGLVHSLGLEEAKTMVRRMDPEAPQTSVEGKHTWELGPLGLKGGEVIAYYAYALDNDTIDGPKMAKSEIHFLTVYDEDEYDSPQSPQPPGQGTPEAVKNLDKLIDVQKKLLQETFALAQNRESSAQKDPADKEKQASAKTAQAQKELKQKVEELATSVEEEMQNMGPAEEPKEGEEGQPKQAPLGEKELAHMRAAAGKMGTAAEQLAETKPVPAVKPEMEALRELSETRRLLLSDKQGDPRFKMAMNNQSKKKKQSREEQQRQDQAQAQQEMQQMPEMMEREKELERELEKLEELKPRTAQQQQPQTEEEKQKEEERRQLKRKVEDQLQKLAEQSKERAEKLEELSKRMEQMRSPAEKAQSAAEKMQQAQQNAKQDQNAQAQEKAHDAARDLQDAQREIRNALEKQFREQLASLRNDAQDLAQRQQDLAQATREMQQAQQPQTGQQQQSQQQQQGEQKSQQQPGQQQQGEQKAQQQGEQKGQQQQGQQQGEQKSQQQQPGQQQSGQQQSNQQQPGQQPSSSGQPDAKSQAKMQALAKRQGEVSGDLNALAERVDAAAQQAEAKQLPSAKALQEAQAQAKSDAPADRSARSAQDALAKGQGEKAQSEQERAAREMEKVAQSLEKAIQRTEAADMKALGEALQKAREIAHEQEKVNEGLAQGKPTTELTGREEKVAEVSQNLSSEAQKLEALKRQNRAGNAKEQLERAANQAREAAEQMRAATPDKAKEPAGRAEQALNAAVNEMERAAGQRLEDEARKAQALAKESREQQEHAAASAREIPQPKPGEPLPAPAAEKRDQAAAQERNAARKARQLDQALEGLEEMSKEVQPAASQIAREAHETSQEARLPQSMEDLARDLQNLGAPKKDETAKPSTPSESAARGEDLAKTVKQIERQLEQFAAQANGSPLDRLRALEQEAKANAKEAQRMAEQAKDPKADPAQPQLGEQAGKLEKNLERMEPKLGNLEPGAPERKQLDQARESVKQAQKEMAQSKGKSGEQSGPNGGLAFDKAKQHLERMSTGLTERMERILKAREIQPDEDEVAPKEYRTLVDQYYRALSEDVEEKR